MLDVWKQALEHLIHESSTAQRNDARQVMIVARQLGHVGSIGELRQRYASARTAIDTPRAWSRGSREESSVSCAWSRGSRGGSSSASRVELPSKSAALTRSQILDAAFGLRHLEIVTGRPIDVRACRYLSWLLAAAA